MREAYRLTRKDGAPGIDGVTAEQYEANLEANLLALLERIKSGRYVAPPVRRVYIPKADGSERPLGIPTFEDKVAQRAVVMVLEPIYEQEFLSCSFGFRPGRSAHQALSALRLAFMGRQGLRWVLDVDISKYYDTIQHHHLRAFLDRRVTDGVIRRMIDKWLKAGVLEHGLLQRSFPSKQTSARVNSGKATEVLESKRLPGVSSGRAEAATLRCSEDPTLRPEAECKCYSMITGTRAPADGL